MKLSKPEQAVLVTVLLALAVMGGFFWGRNSVADPVRIITQTAEPVSSQPVKAAESGSEETRAAPSVESEPPEESETASFPININTATAEELQTLPGIGQTRAEAIVAYREEHGTFTYVEDLRGVSGIGEGILAKIIDYITVGEQSNG